MEINYSIVNDLMIGKARSELARATKKMVLQNMLEYLKDIQENKEKLGYEGEDFEALLKKLMRIYMVMDKTADKERFGN